jgi:hypothetical protein
MKQEMSSVNFAPTAFMYKDIPVSIAQYWAVDCSNSGSVDAEDQILLDVHFKHPTVVLYRTDVVFGWLDLTGRLASWDGHAFRM